jgi:hypothetical protein
MQTIAIHTEAQIQKEQIFRLWLTQEHNGAKELVDQARHLQGAAGAIEPPRLAHRTSVVALVGETKSGSVVLG